MKRCCGKRLVTNATVAKIEVDVEVTVDVFEAAVTIASVELFEAAVTSASTFADITGCCEV